MDERMICPNCGYLAKDLDEIAIKDTPYGLKWCKCPKCGHETYETQWKK